MTYRVIDTLSETGEQDESICGELIGITESEWQAMQIYKEYVDECSAQGIECDVQIYDETDCRIYYS